MIVRPRRSALYMPATNARAIEKARALPCDVVILDLEDAVAPESKAEARATAVAMAKAGGFGGREVVIRVNGLDTPWGADDLDALSALQGIGAILLPKVSAAADLARYRSLHVQTPFWAMIETCAAMFELREIARASRACGVQAWVLGTNDLAKEMRCRLDAERSPLVPALASAVMAARCEALAVLDGVYNDIDDDGGLASQCAQGAALGFDGKTLIHPRQLDAANRAFSPTPEEIAWSRRIVDAFALSDNANRGALRIDGRMVERLHLAEAERILAVAEAIAA